jgi:hypothetical protein
VIDNSYPLIFLLFNYFSVKELNTATGHRSTLTSIKTNQTSRIMSKKLKTVFLILIAGLLVYYSTNRIFKVNYSENDVVLVDSLRINDSTKTGKAYVVLGKNYKGVIEATLFPSEEQRYKESGVVEYYYLRFAPDWYEQNISPQIKTKLDNGERLSSDLIKKAKNVHEDNFQYCCHVNDYPIVNEGQLFARVSLVGVADKVTMLLDRK